MRIILSGGGTGGHIYPAVAVAEALKRRLGTQVEILFVGAEGRMEMEKIPALGYRIVGLSVTGLQRKMTVENLTLPFKVAGSVIRSRKIIKEFGADVVAGFGGYASGPVLWTAQLMGIPTLVQEQNSYAGITNKLLARRARRICVAWQGMQRFFPEERIVLTGNPLRSNFSSEVSAVTRSEAFRYFGLKEGVPTLLVIGGSLGTRTLNEMMKRHVDRISKEGRMQVIWQTGSIYEPMLNLFMQSRKPVGIWRGAFIQRMDLAYAAADVVVSRSGAGTISELELVGKPTIFVPSPNVAEDHQTANARALERQGAALLVPDAMAIAEVMPLVEGLLADEKRRNELSLNISKLAMPDAADRIVTEILALVPNEQ